MTGQLPLLVEVDLSTTTRQGSTGLTVGPTYLCLIGGQFHVGQFEQQWYGLNFRGLYGSRSKKNKQLMDTLKVAAK